MIYDTTPQSTAGDCSTSSPRGQLQHGHARSLPSRPRQPAPGPDHRHSLAAGTVAARGQNPPAFERRCIRAGRFAQLAHAVKKTLQSVMFSLHSTIPKLRSALLLGPIAVLFALRRALPARRLAALGARAALSTEPLALLPPSENNPFCVTLPDGRAGHFAGGSTAADSWPPRSVPASPAPPCRSRGSTKSST